MEPSFTDLLKYRLDDRRLDILQEYADYRGISRDQAAALVEGGQSHLDPGAAVDAFYAESEQFLLSLLRSKINLPHLSGRLEVICQVLRGSAAGRSFEILDLGGGLGDYCILAQRLGHRCTYADIPGVIMDFSSWRFRARGLPVERCRADGLPDRKFDFLFNFDVLEHLEDPVGALVQIAAHLKTGGVLCLSVDFLNFNEPFHLKKNLVYAFIYERLLQALGFALEWDNGLDPLPAAVYASPRLYKLAAPAGSGEELRKLAYAKARELAGEYAGYMKEALKHL